MKVINHWIIKEPGHHKHIYELEDGSLYRVWYTSSYDGYGGPSEDYIRKEHAKEYLAKNNIITNGQ